MTIITIDRAVVEQALKALLKSHTCPLLPDDCEAAINNLRAALAQQAEQVEPVATITECEACFTPDVCQLRGTCDHYAASQLRVATQPKRPAEPVEPVAEARYDGTLRWLEPHGVGLHRIQGPLYTAPPQRKPLTEEEIDALPWNGSPRQFARAIERAHGIGEGA